MTECIKCKKRAAKNKKDMEEFLEMERNVERVRITADAMRSIMDTDIHEATDGESEQMKPNPAIIKIIERIVEQNEMIIRYFVLMNTTLIYHKPEDKTDK